MFNSNFARASALTSSAVDPAEPNAQGDTQSDVQCDLQSGIHPSCRTLRSSRTLRSRSSLRGVFDKHAVDLDGPSLTWASTVADSGCPAGQDSMAWQRAYTSSLAVAGFAAWVNSTQETALASYDQQQVTSLCKFGDHHIGIVPVTGLPNAQVAVPCALLCDRTIKAFVLVGVHCEAGPEAQPQTVTTVLSALYRDQLQLSQLVAAGDDYLIGIKQFDVVPEQLQLYLSGLCHTDSPRVSRGRTGLSGRCQHRSSSPSTAHAHTTANHTAPELTYAAARESSSWRQIVPAGPLGAALDGELETLLGRLASTDIEIPPEPNGVYTDVSIGEFKLRLYALVWTMDGQPDEALAAPELSLFLVLGPIAGSYLPMGSQLSVKENNLLMADQTLQWMSNPSYLYTQVFGSWDKKFTVEILLPQTRPFVLPPLTFSLD